MKCETAQKLILEATRSQQTDSLRPYSDNLTRQLFRETRSLAAELEEAANIGSQIADDASAVCYYTVSALAMQRNKRCALAYHYQRTEKVRDVYWERGAAIGQVLGADVAGGEVRRNLSPAEIDFARAYSNLVMDYKAGYSDLLDVAAPLGRPPKELYIQVRVLKDAGEIETEFGSMDFRTGQQFFVRRPDVERLLVQGFLEEVH